MPNAVKYSTSSETLALKKGNFYIATGDVDKGTTSNSGYWNGITPPTSGYTIYLNKASNGPSIYVADNDSELISLTSLIAGNTYTTVSECLNYFAGQTDKMVLNRDYESVITNGLIYNFDASFTPSYPKNGTTWYNIAGTNNVTLYNSPTYNGDYDGSIDFDGANDYAISGNVTISSDQTFSVWGVREGGVPALVAGIFTQHNFGSNANFGINHSRNNKFSASIGYTDNTREYIDKQTNYTLTQNVIWCVSLVYSSATNSIIFYVNGQFDSSFALTKTPKSTNFPVCFGRWDAGFNNYYFNGKIYNSQIYNRALSANEIFKNYEAIGKRFVSLEVQSLVVAGGGSGGGYGYPSGGGGAGGLLTGYTTSLITNTNYTITVGAGGSSNSNGSNSVFNTLTSIGGGRGGNGRSGAGVSGGSGGGGGSNFPADGNLVNYLTPSGSGTAGQGNSGGVGKSVYATTVLNGIPTGAGGGGGAGTVGGVGGTGTTSPTLFAGSGGTGLYFSEYTSIGGSPNGWFAGGGGGSTSYSNNALNAIGIGGNGGGGNGSYTSFSSGPTATDGLVNTGGGGGGAGYIENSSSNGGSGIIILRVPDVYKAIFSSGVGYTETVSNGYKYYKVTATSTTSETVYFT